MARLETGPVQMPDDWPGVYIRGDQALHFAMALRAAERALSGEPSAVDVAPWLTGAAIEGLRKTLESCQADLCRDTAQKIKFAEPTP